ncbi:MAG TPA: hypothetical protein VGB82_18055 [Alphaproteobacteria bacterium]
MGARSLKFVFGLTGLIGLAACQGPVQTVSVSPDAVVIRHTADSGNVAADWAARYCAQYNKRARWRSSSAEPTSQDLTIYDCVPM